VGLLVERGSVSVSVIGARLGPGPMATADANLEIAPKKRSMKPEAHFSSGRPTIYLNICRQSGYPNQSH
jgi:hypothetical protein